MAASETTCMKACKLCIACINEFSQQTRWLSWQNEMCIVGKKLHLVLSDLYLMGFWEAQQHVRLIYSSDILLLVMDTLKKIRFPGMAKRY